MVWDRDDEDCETSTLWSSPDLQPLLAELASSATPRRPASTTVSFVITGQSAGTEVYSFDHGECFAPTLAYEL